MGKKDVTIEEMRKAYLLLNNGKKQRVKDFTASLLHSEYNQQRKLSPREKARKKDS